MLELAVLGLLAEQPLHGYELKKRLSETLGPLWGISFGSLYPALRRLERSGAIEATETQEPSRGGNVSTGSLDGDLAAARLRRRALPGPPHPQGVPASPTPAGPLFAELLTDDSTDDERTFALKLSFCRYLDAADRLAFLERRRDQLTAAAQQGAPRARAGPSIATPGRSSSTGPSPPSTISSGSTS